jgi:hypothetical protein
MKGIKRRKIENKKGSKKYMANKLPMVVPKAKANIKIERSIHDNWRESEVPIDKSSPVRAESWKDMDLEWID